MHAIDFRPTAIRALEMLLTYAQEKEDTVRGCVRFSGAVARLEPDSAELQTLELTERGDHEVVQK